MRDLFVNSVAWLTGHPPDLQSSVDANFQKRQGNKSLQRYLSMLIPDKKVVQPRYERPSVLADDLKHYQFIYTPVKQEKIDTQFVYLERLLADAKKENVKVCLVQMPLSEPNLRLLSAKLRQSILARAKHLAQKYCAAYCTPEAAASFALSDFEDSSHLNAAGGRKFFNTLAAETAQLELWKTNAETGKVANTNGPI